MDFDKSRIILEAATERSPDVPGLSGDLGRTYAGLARLARDEGDEGASAKWFGKSLAAFRSCIDRAPDRFREKRDLKQVESEISR